MRPIVHILEDATDLKALTPSHFLIDRPLLQPPLTEEALTAVADSRITLWGRQQKLVQSFWQRWKEKHLISLQIRAKRNTTSKNVQVGDIVIALSENTPPTCWPLGRVMAVYLGADGQVIIRNATTTLIRPIIRKRCRLRPENSGVVLCGDRCAVLNHKVPSVGQ